MGDTDAHALRGDPDLFVRIAENALTVASDLREEYFKSTLGLARTMREEFRQPGSDYRIRPVPAGPAEPCAVAFVDGGLSQVDLGLGVPLIARAGIYRVKEGERDPEKRETFDHFPLLLGQLRGGLKADQRYGDVVRVLIELGALVTALEDDAFGDIRLLMLHGPLQFVSGPFFEHWFLPDDYEQMLGLAEGRPHVREVLGQFTSWCNRCRLNGSARCVRDITERHLPAVCMMAFLQDYVFQRASDKGVLVCGVVERSRGRSITKYIVKRLLNERPEVFERLLEALAITGRGEARVDAILDATRYNDAVLLALSLERGEQLEWHPVAPRLKVRDERTALFPSVQTTFVRTANSKHPMRIEAPLSRGASELDEMVVRTYDYASLLPNFAFPVGLDIADKYAAVPSWMTKAYKQMILAEYGRLCAGEYVEMTDVEQLQMMLITGGQGRRRRKERPEV